MPKNIRQTIQAYHGEIVGVTNHRYRSWEHCFEFFQRIKATGIVVTSPRGGHRLILDAKYKLTTPSPDRPDGILREDLYQMASYLSLPATSGERLDGGLVYPASDAVHSLCARGPFKLARTNARFNFYHVDCSEEAAAPSLSRSEQEFLRAVASSLL